MNMAGATDSQLEEKFPDGRHRTTTYANDPEEWEEIEVALTSVADRLSRIAASESELQGILDLNTV
jgi:predicted HAD superfamily Cof-like phosphohydrolase